MIVYHAGTEIIEHPLVGIGRDKLDFGKGFYVTNILEQAKTWAERMSSYRGKEPVINKYELNLEIISAKYRHRNSSDTTMSGCISLSITEEAKMTGKHMMWQKVVWLTTV